MKDTFSISKAFNPNKIFLIQRNELEKRLDAEYYTPAFVLLEKKVFSRKPRKLRDFVLSIASGATPKTTESELYYTNKKNGKPFLRVQNLSPTGEVKFDDCKYINHGTHCGILKRSQVSAGDLLVKITGVGRMAVASVAPEGFDGNINQHICVIKTGSREVSETLAAFLNSDIGERLASRRSTGGTRPALDFPALLSIPILYDKRILEISRKVVEQKTKNEAIADKLLASIDDYLLNELGITLLKLPEDVLKNRTYIASVKSISGNRFDPFFHQKKFRDNVQSITDGKFPVKLLREIMHGNLIKGTLPKHEEKNGDNSVIQINSINSDGTISFDNLLTARDIFHKDQKLRKGDILIVITGATIGKIAYWDCEGEFYLGGDIVRFQCSPLVNSCFIYFYLRSQLSQIVLKRYITGATNGHISQEDIKHLLVPIPPIEKQHEIANQISDLRQRAQRLKEQTNDLLKKANEEIEQILLN